MKHFEKENKVFILLFKFSLKSYELFSLTGNVLGVCEAMYKVKDEEQVLREIWLAFQNVTTRVSLL